MHVARDIAGVTLPFAVGVLLTAYAGDSVCKASSAIHFLTLAGIFTSVIVLLRRRQHQPRPAINLAFTIFSACLCGILSGITGLTLTYQMPESALETFATCFGKDMQKAIDAIPFTSPVSNALIKALLTGERSSLPAGVQEAFRDSGASHILALSGLHLGIIYGILSKSLCFLGNGTAAQRFRSVLTVILCGFYTIATGAGPSIVRAFIFIVLGETARLTGRARDLKHVLLSALLLQLIFSPMSIRNIGFQLSYAAMAGIAFIYPHLRDFWPSEKAGWGLVRAMRWIWDSAALSISCQLTTGPLAYIYFGTFPRHFLLTNLISLPLTGLVIPCSLICLVLSCLGWCPPFMVIATEWLVSLLTWSLEVIASM